MMRKGEVTMKGMPVTLEGPALAPGDDAPDFTLLAPDLRPVSLGDLRGKIKIISVTPSLDTQVCDMQARKFDKEALRLGVQTVVLNVSLDLPFAIKRFCTEAGIERLIALSDHRDAAFGKAYGVLIAEHRLLARAVFVLDAKDVIRYVQIVPEVTDHPDYAAALRALGQLTAIKV